MMSDDKNKKQATMIIASMSKPKPEMESEETPSSEDELTYVADEIMSAFEKKDAKALAEALKSFYTLCEDCEPAEEPEAE